MAQPDHPMHEEALQAVETLIRAGDQVFIVAQNVAEFWNVATRPLANNGLGFSVQEAHEEVKRFSTILPLLPETDRIYPEWLRLVVLYAVSGVKVYDARLVAAMSVHGVTRILTFNAEDFTRYASFEVFRPTDIHTE